MNNESCNHVVEQQYPISVIVIN